MATRVGKKKINLITCGNWSDLRSSGKLINPGKACYMGLAICYVKDVNSMIGDDGVSLPRKAIIKCVLSLNTKKGKGRLLNCLNIYKTLFPGTRWNLVEWNQISINDLEFN